ncbi:MAG: 4Fe-4S ferredoxin, partial [Candidatus Helarchaeota archaeon]|nr:4Fe-4S ferredoxin [Candidatus Helarchaeota archaeon]
MEKMVYFMDARAIHMNQALTAKVAALFDAAKFQNLFNEGEYVAIKLHMGEFNNTGYLRDRKS